MYMRTGHSRARWEYPTISGSECASTQFQNPRSDRVILWIRFTRRASSRLRIFHPRMDPTPEVVCRAHTQLAHHLVDRVCRDTAIRLPVDAGHQLTEPLAERHDLRLDPGEVTRLRGIIV